jgi:hypothetical protein
MHDLRGPTYLSHVFNCSRLHLFIQRIYGYHQEVAKAAKPLSEVVGPLGSPMVVGWVGLG